MLQSNFIEYINRIFTSKFITTIVETFNGTKEKPNYFYKRFLKKDFSVSGKWESISTANTMVMADVVALDSSLPLKKRDSISKANGDIPKMGMELKLNEKQLTELDTLALTPGTESQLVQKLFADTPRVIGGIFERNEAMFLEALSTGLTVVDDAENVGTGVRLDYNIPTANKFGADTVIWSNTSSTPLSDLDRMQAQAATTGNVITRFLMDRTAFNNMVKTDEVKEVYAFFVGFNGVAIQSPTLSRLNAALQDRSGYTIEIIDRSVRYEKNGVQTSVKPWADGAVVGITTENLGSIVWANLAEKNHPVDGVNYQTADEYVLVSKFRVNTPSLSEVTRSQARAVPVLTNTDQIYILDTKNVQA